MPIYFYLRATSNLESIVLTANQSDLTMHMVVRRNENGLECLRRCLAGQEDHKNCVYVGANKYSVRDILAFIAYELVAVPATGTLTDIIKGARDVE